MSNSNQSVQNYMSWYAKLTTKQWQTIRDRQNARNMKTEQKQAKRDQYKVR